MARYNPAAHARRLAGAKPRAKMKRPEQDFQIKVVVPYLKAILDPSETYWFAVPNGGARSPVEGGILKAMGLKAGMTDIVVLGSVAANLCGIDCLRRVVCLIELKEPSGKGRLNADQVETHADLDKAGFMPRVCESLEEVRAALVADEIPMRPHKLYMGGGFVVPR